MAHLFSNFDEAFGVFVAEYDEWKADLAEAQGYSNQAHTYALAGQWYNAIEALRSVFAKFFWIHNSHLAMYAPTWDTNQFFESIYWSAQEPTGGAVDMDAIINAMLSASFDQLQHFIGIEDAYRVALWNAPFNAEFYAALARGFQKWP